MVAALTDNGDQGQWLTGKYPKKGYFGTKFSSSFTGNQKKSLPVVISTISLYSGQTGQLEVVIEANALTAIKTAGSAAIATELLSRKNSSRLAIIGAGVQAFDQVLAIREVRDIRHVIVYDRNPGRAETFIDRLKATDGFNATTEAAQTADMAVSQADIVCTCTTSKTPVFDGSKLPNGTHINAIGSYTPDMQEIDADTVIRSGCVFTEHVDGLWAAAGDILKPYQSGVIDRSKVTGSLGDLLVGAVSGRESEEQITLYESVGSAVLDLALAVETYRLASDAINCDI